MDPRSVCWALLTSVVVLVPAQLTAQQGADERLASSAVLRSLPPPVWRGGFSALSRPGASVRPASQTTNAQLRVRLDADGDRDWLYPVGGLVLGAAAGVGVGVYRCANVDYTIYFCIPFWEVIIGSGAGMFLGAVTGAIARGHP